MTTPMQAPDRGTAPARVVAALREALAGAPPGAPLPSVRDLCAQLAASPNTVQRAIAALGREGAVVTVPNRGSFVAPQARVVSADVAWQSLALGARPPYSDDLRALVASARPGVISLRGGYADESLQPLSLLNAAMARATRRPGAWGRQPSEGSPDLRAWFAREVGGRSTAADTLIVPGGQSALAVVIRALCPPGSSMLFESPTYVGATAVARAAGVSPVPVPSDRDGVRPDLLAAAFRASGARLFYCQPAFANPNGSVLAADRREAVVRAAADAGAFILEDDFARDLSHGIVVPAPLLTLDPGRVIYVRSLTKSAAAGLRVAAVCARGPVAERIRAARNVDDLFVSGPLQETALELVTSTGWPRHLRALQLALRRRCDAAVGALRVHWPSARLSVHPKGGYHLWVELPEGTEEAPFISAAGELGVEVNGGRAWFPAEASGSFVRISYAACAEDDLVAGIARLGAA